MGLIAERAKYFAWGAHSAVEQKRKYSGEDYAVHPEEVVQILRNFASEEVTDEMMAAAYLHDTVEDTGVTIEVIKKLFGDVVAEYVGWLTDVSKLSDGNRAIRKRIDLEHTAQAPRQVKTIKLADLISNSLSIVENDPGFARKYIEEKTSLLTEALIDSDPGLYAEAVRVNDEARKELFGNDDSKV